MSLPDDATWAILKEADQVARENGTTAAVVLAMQVQMLACRIGGMRIIDPRSRPRPDECG